MNLTSPTQTRALLAELGFTPSSRHGQNFLVDANVLRLIVETAGVGPQDVVLEVGPGLGVLTAELVARAARVVAVEIDRALHAHLVQRFGESARLELIRANVLDLPLAELVGSRGVSKVVSNLPYSVGSRVVMELTQLQTPPAEMVLTLQREVAERMQAREGTPERGLLSVWVQRAYEVRHVRRVSATCFVPRPKVESAFIHLVRAEPEGTWDEREARAFRRLTQRAFQQRRKQLGTTFRRPAGDGAAGAAAGGACEALAAAGIDARRRPEELSVAEWVGFARAGAARGAGEGPDE